MRLGHGAQKQPCTIPRHHRARRTASTLRCRPSSGVEPTLSNYTTSLTYCMKKKSNTLTSLLCTRGPIRKVNIPLDIRKSLQSARPRHPPLLRSCQSGYTTSIWTVPSCPAIHTQGQTDHSPLQNLRSGRNPQKSVGQITLLFTLSRTTDATRYLVHTRNSKRSRHGLHHQKDTQSLALP